MPFLLPNQQHQSTEGIVKALKALLTRWQCAINNSKFYAACFQLASDCKNVLLTEANDAVTRTYVVK